MCSVFVLLIIHSIIVWWEVFLSSALISSIRQSFPLNCLLKHKTTRDIQHISDNHRKMYFFLTCARCFFPLFKLLQGRWITQARKQIFLWNCWIFSKYAFLIEKYVWNWFGQSHIKGKHVFSLMMTPNIF